VPDIYPLLPTEELYFSRCTFVYVVYVDARAVHHPEGPCTWPFLN